MLAACEKGNPPVSQTKPPAAPAYTMPVTESTGAGVREYMRTHLPPGVKPGGFLTEKADYPTGDTADVFRTVLDTLYTARDEKPPLVVLAATTWPHIIGCAKLPCPLLLPEPYTTLSAGTFESFRQATLSRRRIRADFTYQRPLRIMSEEQQRAMWDEGLPASARTGNRDNPFWLTFASRYPGAWGFAWLSSVGMNPEKTEALVEVSHKCGAECASAELMVLKKSGARWQVVERLPEVSDSTDMGRGSLRYRGVGARKPGPDPRAVAAAESVRIAQVPRDIHGVLTDHPYGGPIAGAAVTAAPEEDPNKPWARVYSDSAGAYTIANPPIGMAYIVVRCPQGTVRPDGLMAVTHADVRLAKKLQFNMAIDKRNCDDPGGTPQPIVPPFDAPPMANGVDSARARAAKYPSNEEAEVYGAVLRGLGTPAGDKVMLVYATTKSQCEGAGCAEEYRQRIRYVPEVFLSTMENFLAVREKKMDLRQGFSGIPNVVLLGDSTLNLLGQAVGQSDVIYNPSVIRMAWPSVEKVVQLSPVAFSPRHRQAMVEVNRGERGTPKGELWILEKGVGDEWLIVKWFR